jgi:hypothetical protein
VKRGLLSGCYADSCAHRGKYRGKKPQTEQSAIYS